MISRAVMACEQRREWAEDLSVRLDAPVVWDRRRDVWDTARRAWLAFDPAASHHVVVQDDAVVADDLIAALSVIAGVVGERAVGLYFGARRPLSAMPVRFRDAKRSGVTLVRWRGPIWGVAIMLPTSHIPSMVRYADRLRVNADDSRIYRYCTRSLPCFYTMPSLVDHRPGPSLVGHTEEGRVAFDFIGERSALDIDWKVGQ